jgi:hypothetical protein
MTEVLLFPRLSRAAARRILQEHCDEVPDVAAARAAGEAATVWGASGGRRITPRELDELREAMLGIAKACGQGTTSTDHAAFDMRCSVWFGESDLVPVGEGLRDDVWTWLAVSLLPDLVTWRFPGRPEDRFLGGARNVFQRHWMRARAFDQGGASKRRWALVSALGEDAMVQILERTSISSQPELAGSIARVWLERSRTSPPGGMQNTARRAIRSLRIVNESRGLAVMEAADLDAVVVELFDDAARLEAEVRSSEVGDSDTSATPVGRSGALWRGLLGRKRP